MAYLDYMEYLGIAINPIEEEKFKKLNKRATSIINVATRHFYQWNDFESDHEWRKQAVKEATAYQVEFFDEAGATTHEALNNNPQSVSLGRTTINKGSRQGSVTSEDKSLLSIEAENALLGTGLLFRGVARG